jgi:CheY-like chemotaxis protein
MFNSIKKYLLILSKYYKTNRNFNKMLPNKYEIDLKLPQERIVSNYKPELPTIIIIDDSKGIVSIVEDYLQECGLQSESFNILSFFGQMAPFVLSQTLDMLKEKGLTKVDYAIIDIVLPGKIKKGDKYIKMDGIDVSILLNSKYNCNNFVFYTGNIVNTYVEFIKLKSDKFFSHFNKNIDDYLIFKGNDSDRDVVENFCSLLKGIKYSI